MNALQPVAIVDGERMPLTDARLALTDEGVTRGDGAFETVGVWDGRPFRLADHLDRLQASLRAINLPAVDTDVIAKEAADVVEGVGAVDAALRMYVTASGTRIVTLAPQPARSPARRLVPQPAPWVRPRTEYPPAGAKTMSYGPNMTATRAAERAGGDEALLISTEGLILEGPTFCVMWVRDGRVHTPEPALGIVDSISRRTLLTLAAEAGYQTVEGAWPLAALAAATEAMICSSVRPVIALTAVGDVTFPTEAPVATDLAARLDRRRRA
jgi:branched-subunit amino acid aminotransferase/4-amino-4-deoxychorismate lyase